MENMHFYRKPVWVVSFLLSNFAALWGFLVAPVYVVGFCLLLPYAQDPTALAGGMMSLPMAPPLTGVVLAGLGGLLGAGRSTSERGVIVFGLISNGLSLSLAWALLVVMSAT